MRGEYFQQQDGVYWSESIETTVSKFAALKEDVSQSDGVAL